MTSRLALAAFVPKREHRSDAREQERASARAHRIAERLQRVLLRTYPPDALPGLALAAFYAAALDEATVGGDSFDAFPLADGRVALVVADASGKGLAAAERVAEVRFALRAFLREHHDPERALACLNDFVCDCHRLDGRDDGTFATLTLAILDSFSGEMACLCAGGEPPLVLRAGGTVEAVQTSGPMLGLLPGQNYTVKTARLCMGDALLLTTDGLTEARRLDLGGLAGSRTGDFLGLEGLSHLALQAQDRAETLCTVGRSVFEGARLCRRRVPRRCLPAHRAENALALVRIWKPGTTRTSRTVR